MRASSVFSMRGALSSRQLTCKSFSIRTIARSQNLLGCHVAARRTSVVYYNKRNATHTSLPQHSATRSLSPSSSPDVDTIIENLTELYATAQDEFEIAYEETEKKTVYAEADRAAAYEALVMLRQAYVVALEEDEVAAAEIKRRVGHRIRELEQGFARLDELVQEGD